MIILEEVFLIGQIKYNSHNYRNQLNDFINHLSLDNVTLMGVSMGAL